MPRNRYASDITSPPKTIQMRFPNNDISIFFKIKIGSSTVYESSCIEPYEYIKYVELSKSCRSDIEDANVVIEYYEYDPVNGKKYTKSEILRYYNKLVTENIIESFVELDRKFSNPKEIEKLLKEQIKGSDRYDADLLNACTLDENGHFVIPLFDPLV